MSSVKSWKKLFFFLLRLRLPFLVFFPRGHYHQMPRFRWSSVVFTATYSDFRVVLESSWSLNRFAPNCDRRQESKKFHNQGKYQPCNNNVLPDKKLTCLEVVNGLSLFSSTSRHDIRKMNGLCSLSMTSFQSSLGYY